jgi:disulfide bond formation protein DsbB
MYETLIFALDFPIIIIFSKKALQMFCANNECDSDSKEWCFLPKWMIAQKCDTNKNVTKMGVIIKENYYIQI